MAHRGSPPGRTMARTGLRMMPTFPLSSLKFRTAGFPQYGFKAGISGGAFPSTARSARRAVCIRPSCSSLNLVFSRSESGDGLSLNTSVRAAIAALPQGPSLRSGLCCPGPSSLNWSHAPHSQAHLDFTETAYTRCLRCAAYCDLGNPRVDPCFRWHSVSTCRPPGPREVHSAAYTQFLHRRRWPSTKGDCGLGTSKIPHPPILVGGSVFEASLRFTFVATCRFARPPVGADQVFTQPTWTFTSGLPTDWSPAPPPDITTVATGQVPPAGLSPASMPTSIAATPHGPHRADFPQQWVLQA